MAGQKKSKRSRQNSLGDRFSNVVIQRFHVLMIIMSIGIFVGLGLVAATTHAASADPIVKAAGDIACPPAYAVSSSECQQAATARQLSGASAVLELGDAQYENNLLSNFLGSYDKSWGAYKSVTHPVPGNHEYQDKANATGYFDYFNGTGASTGRAGTRGKGYYSFNVGSWHVIALNANCGIDPSYPDLGSSACAAGSTQEKWLKADLAAHPGVCTLAFWHEPRFSSGGHGSNPVSSAFWTDLYAAHADLVLNGHDHDYERFTKMSPSGAADTKGIREFVVGTGGRNLAALGTLKATSQSFHNTTFGVLSLNLHTHSYDYSFKTISGGTLDGGSGIACNQ
jgi:hypothetical protein